MVPALPIKIIEVWESGGSPAKTPLANLGKSYERGRRRCLRK
jgi:hypothetical protein